VGFPGCVDLGVDRLVMVGACVDNFLERREADVEAALIMFGDILMAGPAGFRRVGIRWVLDQSGMGLFPVRLSRVATMAFFTPHVAVVFIFGKFTVDKNLFVWRQRRHVSASPLSFRFF
jgi:hypothetical protein